MPLLSNWCYEPSSYSQEYVKLLLLQEKKEHAQEKKEHTQEKKKEQENKAQDHCCLSVEDLGSVTWACCWIRPWIVPAGDEDLGLGVLRRSRGPAPGTWAREGEAGAGGGEAGADDGLAENFKSWDGGGRRWGCRFKVGVAM